MREEKLLKPGERIDDLMRSHFRIIQNPEKFCFGMDAVLLSGFARVKRGEKVLDLGTGTGILPLLLAAKTEGEHFTGIEIQPDMADMAGRSVLLNEVEDRIDIVCGDLRQSSARFGKAAFDVVVSNPPYMKESHGLKNPDDAKATARHEVSCTLEDVIREASDTLRSGGRFYLVHRPRRLAEIFCCLREHRLEPKQLRMVHSRADSEANMVLIEAVRGGGAWLKVLPPLIVYREPGVYNEEIRTIYGY